MVAGASLPPGGRGLRARRHPPPARILHTQLQAGQQVLAGGDGILATRHRVHSQSRECA